MIVREFLLRDGCERDFELAFAPDGVWANLLRPRSPGYVGTEVKTIAKEERRHEVRDVWRSHYSFEVFRDWYQADVERFRDWLASKEWVEQEKFLGGFYVKEPEGGDEAGWVAT